jgi:hypothetical protein
MSTDSPWLVNDRKKIKGKTNSRAYRIDIRLLDPTNKEGYNRLIITIPVGLDGSGLDGASLFGEACIYASQVISRIASSMASRTWITSEFGVHRRN